MQRQLMPPWDIEAGLAALRDGKQLSEVLLQKYGGTVGTQG